MKILMLVNWKIEYCDQKPMDKQPPDYRVHGEDYWFYRYFREKPEVDVVDVRSFPWLERFEKEKLRFYIWQTLRMLPKLGQYDLIVSHGMQSGVVISLLRRLFKTKAKHIVFDIGSFNSAAESGMALRLMQFASRSIDGLIYHTSSQRDYYAKYFPWIVEKSRFIRFGTDLELFSMSPATKTNPEDPYILCVGFAWRDRNTLVKAYKKLNARVKLRFVGHVDPRYADVPGIEQIPRVPVTEMIRQIRAAEFCVLPLVSYNYSYGQMTLLQQMALGKCVIAARVPSLVDYVEDGKTALFYEPENSEDLARKMEMVLNTPEAFADMPRQARTWMQEACNEKHMASEVEQFIEDILQRE